MQKKLLATQVWPRACSVLSSGVHRVLSKTASLASYNYTKTTNETGYFSFIS